MRKMQKEGNMSQNKVSLYIDITPKMQRKIKAAKPKNSKMSDNMFIVEMIRNYVIDLKVREKLKDNSLIFGDIANEAFQPVIKRLERLIDRIEEDFVYIREDWDEYE